MLARELEWIQIVKPPQAHSLPDIPTRAEVQRLINGVRRLRYRVFFFAVYTMGLRVGEGLGLEVGHINAQLGRVHVRQGEPLCLADFNHAGALAQWLQSRNAVLRAPIKDYTSFERSPPPARKP